MSRKCDHDWFDHYKVSRGFNDSNVKFTFYIYQLDELIISTSELLFNLKLTTLL